jgi:hypothetical protein
MIYIKVFMMWKETFWNSKKYSIIIIFIYTVYRYKIQMQQVMNLQKGSWG